MRMGSPSQETDNHLIKINRDILMFLAARRPPWWDLLIPILFVCLFFK